MNRLSSSFLLHSSLLNFRFCLFLLMHGLFLARRFAGRRLGDRAYNFGSLPLGLAGVGVGRVGLVSLNEGVPEVEEGGVADFENDEVLGARGMKFQ